MNAHAHAIPHGSGALVSVPRSLRAYYGICQHCTIRHINLIDFDWIGKTSCFCNFEVNLKIKSVKDDLAVFSEKLSKENQQI